MPTKNLQSIIAGLIATSMFMVGLLSLVSCRSERPDASGLTAKEAAAIIESSADKEKNLNYWQEELFLLNDRAGKKYYVCCLSHGSTAWDVGGLGLFDANGHLLSFETIDQIHDYVRLMSVLCHWDSILIRVRVGIGTDVLRLKYVLYTIIDGKLRKTFECAGDENVIYGEASSHFDKQVTIKENGEVGRLAKLTVITTSQWFADDQAYRQHASQHTIISKEEFLFDPEVRKFDWNNFNNE